MKIPVIFNSLFDWIQLNVKLASELGEEIEPYFMVSVAKYRKQLLASHISEEQILDISISRKEVIDLGPPSKDVLAQIREYENYGPSILSLIMMSRYYSADLSEGLTHYLCLVAFRMEEFLKKNKIQWVFCEPSHAPDILLYTVSKKIGIRCGKIALVRFPTDRVCIFSDIRDSGLHPLSSEPNAPTQEDAERWLKKFRAKQQIPAYCHNHEAHRSLFGLMVSVIKRSKYILEELLGKGQINYTSTTHLLSLYSRRFYSSFRPYDKNFDGKYFTDRTPFAVYFLQVQPENSVDVFAPYYSNQLEVIKAIRRSLPAGFRLVVKDHPSAYGIQQLKFYRGIKKIPGVSLISGNFNSRQVLENAVFSATISGTIGMEAAFLKLPIIVFSNVFFSVLPNVYQCSSLPHLETLVAKALEYNRKSIDDAPIINFIHKIMLNSHVSSWDGKFNALSSEVIQSLSKLLKRAFAYSEK